MESNKIESKNIKYIATGGNNLERIPFLNLQQIIIEQENIQMIKNNGIKVIWNQHQTRWEIFVLKIFLKYRRT